jgi:hypothetical protein
MGIQKHFLAAVCLERRHPQRPPHLSVGDSSRHNGQRQHPSFGTLQTLYLYAQTTNFVEDKPGDESVIEYSSTDTPEEESIQFFSLHF